MTDSDAPQWSNWTEPRDLGFADTPQKIVCRACGVVKSASPLHFRRLRASPIGYSYKCLVCEAATPHRRKINGRIAEVKGLTHYKGAPITEAERAQLIAQLPDVIRAEKADKLRAFQTERHADQFVHEWAKVRKLVAERREMLYDRMQTSKSLTASRGRGTGITVLMRDARVERYVHYVLAIYSSVVARLRDTDAWRVTTGGSLPSKRWRKVTAMPVDTREQRAARLEAMLELSPFEFTTPAERVPLRTLDPDKLGCTDWQTQISRNERRNGTMRFLLYPLQTLSGQTIADTSPPWLRKFNGANQVDVGDAEPPPGGPATDNS